MASANTWTNICPECGKRVDILNGDLQFSMELHKQSHKSLDHVNAIDRNLNRSTEKIDNTTKLKLNYCHDCKDNFEIVNNDLSLSFQLHAQQHKLDNADARSDHSSASSSKSRGPQPMAKDKDQPVVTNILDAIFHTMPTGLKAHRGFISEQGCSKAVCSLCEITIEPVFRLSDHLKTKQHEDNTISVIKNLLSSELNDQMEFISFYGSNLCCNLCRCKIDLCSENLHKTAVNIFIHNASKGHSSKKTTSKDNNQSNEALVILTSLALVDPSVNNNMHFIEHKMYPYFKCKPCEKQIAYSENQKEVLSNFNNHFNSQGHVKYLSAVSLLKKWNTLNIAGKENHNFVVSKQNIYCTNCNIEIETNLDQLLTHIRRNSALYGAGLPESVPGIKANNSPDVDKRNAFPSKGVNMKSKSETFVNKPSESQKPLVQSEEPSAKFRRLIQSLPIQFRNIITQDKKGNAVCTVCKCIIPASTYNLTTHLNGGSHMKKQSEANLSDKVKNSSQRPKTANSQVRETPQTDLIKLKDEMSLLLPKHSDALVRELFDYIPMSFQKDMKFFKAPVGVNFVFCEICYIKIPKQVNCLLEHLEDRYHETSVQRFNGIQPNPTVVPIVKSEGSDTLFQELLKCNKEIKANSKYFCKFDDDYFCKLCKAVIKNSYDINLLEGNMVSHMNGKKHKKNVEHEFNEMLNRIQLASSLVKNNRQYLKKVKDFVVCTSCSCQMPLTDSIEAMKHNLEVHLLGSTHKKMLEAKASASSAAPPLEAVQSRLQREMAQLAHKTLFCDVLGYDEEEYMPLKF